MKAIYRSPRLTALVAAVTAAGPAPARELPAQRAGATTGAPTRSAPPPHASRVQYWGCGLGQVLWLLFPFFALAGLGTVGYRIIAPGSGLVDTYLRALAVGTGATVALFALPIAAKWLLIGRWEPEEIVVWTPRYLRFWIVKSMVQRNPLLHLMMGSPLYGVYLRALGATIGPGATILTRQFPICTDLFTVGAGAVIRKDAVISCYRAEAGVIRTGPINIGAHAVVGDAAVLDINTSIGEHAQLGHASSLHPGQAIPAGERWYGSPAQPGEVDFARVEPMPSSRGRRARFTCWQVLTVLLVTTPVSLLLLGFLGTAGERLVGLRGWGEGSLSDGSFYVHAAWAAFVLYVGSLLVVLPVLLGASRVLGVLVRPDRTYPLHGFHHGLQRSVAGMTNTKSYPGLFGDSSAIVHYLRAIGYRLAPYQQTGTNFGSNLQHDTPFHVSVGTGTVVADGLSVCNAEFSSSSFRVTPIRIGAHNFLGNAIVYPVDGRTGDNCLLATKVMIPIDGEIRSGVGLLGSPAFEIPRTVARDTAHAVADPELLRRGLRAKGRHNVVTVVLHLLVRWVFVFGALVFSEWAGELFRGPGWWAVGLADTGFLAATIAYFVLVERAVAPLAVLRPDGVSIYHRDFWRHERYWKVPQRGYEQLFNGTPVKPLLLRAVGATIGRRVFDDGSTMPEKNFVTIGDGATLNAGAAIQTHSQEDGAFKSTRTTIGPGATLGVHAFVHYGVRVGEGAVLAADCFLMKGEEVPPHAYWGGNPAHELPRP